MNQFERDMNDIEQGDFVEINYVGSMNDKQVTVSGVVDEIEENDEYPTVTVRCGNSRELRLTWNLNLGGKFGVEKVAFQDSILGNDGEIELLHDGL